MILHTLFVTIVLMTAEPSEINKKLPFILLFYNNSVSLGCYLSLILQCTFVQEGLYLNYH